MDDASDWVALAGLVAILALAVWLLVLVIREGLEERRARAGRPPDGERLVRSPRSTYRGRHGGRRDYRR